MRNGISIHIGLNSVDPSHYQGWQGTLLACEFDAKDMQALAKAQGFTPQMFLTKEATVENVKQAIKYAASELQPGEILFLTYSGHGSRVPDTNADEEDSLDETWVLYDRQLVDDELYSLWAEFKEGVRILMLSDSCHSGSMSKFEEFDKIVATASLARDYIPEGIPGARALPVRVRNETYIANKEVYEGLQRDNPDGEQLDISAGVLLISGCLDEQLAADGKRNGLFTQTLLKVWSKGKFKGTYRKFHKDIAKQMPLWQAPNLSLIGDAATLKTFKKQQPFSI